MKIIDNVTMFVDFENLQPGDVFKVYDTNSYCMKTVGEIETVDNDAYNAVNLSNGCFEWLRGNCQVQKVNATLTLT